MATYIVNALDDGPAVATLPLADARLEKVTVNKAAAFPIAPRPGSYAIPLPGKGRHEIEVVFAVPYSGTDPDRELRFGVPECPVTAPEGRSSRRSRQAQVVGRIGRLTMTGGERRYDWKWTWGRSSRSIFAGGKRWRPGDRQGSRGVHLGRERSRCGTDRQLPRGSIGEPSPPCSSRFPPNWTCWGSRRVRSIPPASRPCANGHWEGNSRPSPLAPSTSRGRPPVGCWWSSPARRVSRSPTSQYCTSPGRSCRA